MTFKTFKVFEISGNYMFISLARDMKKDVFLICGQDVLYFGFPTWNSNFELTTLRNSAMLWAHHQMVENHSYLCGCRFTVVNKVFSALFASFVLNYSYTFYYTYFFYHMYCSRKKYCIVTITNTCYYSENQIFYSLE